MDYLLSRVNHVKDGVDGPRDEVCPNSELGLPVQHTAWSSDIGSSALCIDIPRVENKRLCRVTAKDHHFILV